MIEALETAQGAYARLDAGAREQALRTVKRLNRVRHRIYEKAKQLGYVENCLAGIPICRGECCKWHFPRNLTYLDLFVTIGSISPSEQTALRERIALEAGQNRCPLLLKSGCVLSFDSRPLVCSNAYPCFAGDVYHAFLHEQQTEIDAHYAALNTHLSESHHAGA